MHACVQKIKREAAMTKTKHRERNRTSSYIGFKITKWEPQKSLCPKLNIKHLFFTQLVQRTPPPLFVQGWISLQACDYITSRLWCSFISQALLSQPFEEPAGGLWSERAQWPPSRPILSAQAAHLCSTQNQIPKPPLSLSGLTGYV